VKRRVSNENLQISNGQIQSIKVCKQSLQKVGGSIQTQKGKDIILRDYVYLLTLWKQVKFILHEHELDFDGLLANSLMEDVNVASNERIRDEYWLGTKQR
jgi:hypothetical protein